MQKTLIQNIVEPLFLRVGTAGSALLVGYGMSATHGVTVAQAITLLLGVTFDLVVRRFAKGKQ